ncbi:Trichohyalin [Giardia lamblia P15]|uniref:Trichohyalin n=1 Tax=Giardia intestinalis (strain P15) TaxID=658858 RepID=E1F885_GIAIA|nr:Trichohyalin [Giardia lamblia P15]
MTLTLRHLRALLENYGSIPDDLRKTAWRFMLALPNDVDYYDSLVTRGIHKDAHSLSRLFPISDRRLLVRLQKTCTALYYWSPDLASVSWLAQFVFPFVKFWERDTVAAFETCVILLSTYQSWLQFRDVPPNKEIIFVDAMNTKYTNSSGVGTEKPADWAWRLFIGLFTDQLSGDEWLRFCDHWFCDGHRIFLYAALAAFPVVVPPRYLAESLSAPYHGFSIAEFLKRTREIINMLKRQQRQQGLYPPVYHDTDGALSCPDSVTEEDMSSFLQSRFKLIPTSGMQHMDPIVLPRMTILDYNQDLKLIEQEQKEFVNIMKRAHFRDMVDDPLDTRYSDTTISRSVDSDLSQHGVPAKAQRAIDVSRSGVTNLRSSGLASTVLPNKMQSTQTVARNLGDAGNTTQATAVQDELARSVCLAKSHRLGTTTCEPPSPGTNDNTNRELGSTFTISAFKPRSQQLDQSGRAIQTEDIEFVPVSSLKSQQIAEHIAREMAQEVANTDVHVREATSAIEGDLHERQSVHPAVQKQDSVTYRGAINDANGFVINLSEQARKRSESDKRNKQFIGNAVQHALLKGLTAVRSCSRKERGSRGADFPLKQEPGTSSIGPARARSTEFDLQPQPESTLCQICEDRGVYEPRSGESPKYKHTAANEQFKSSANQQRSSTRPPSNATQASLSKNTPKALPARCIEHITVETQTPRATSKTPKKQVKSVVAPCQLRQRQLQQPQQPKRPATGSRSSQSKRTACSVDKSVTASRAQSLKNSVGVQHVSIHSTTSDTEETQELVSKVDMLLNKDRLAPRRELLELERAPRDTLLDLIDTLDRQVASTDPSTYALRDSVPSSNGSDLIAEKLGVDPQLEYTHPEVRPVIKSAYLSECEEDLLHHFHPPQALNTVDSVRFVSASSKTPMSQQTAAPSINTTASKGRLLGDLSMSDATRTSHNSINSLAQQSPYQIPLVAPQNNLRITIPSVSAAHGSEGGSTSPYTNSDNTQKPSVSFMLPESTEPQDTYRSILARRSALESVSLSSAAMEPLHLNVHPVPHRISYQPEPGFPLAANEKDLTISSVQEPIPIPDIHQSKQAHLYSQPELSRNYLETTTSTFLPQPSVSLHGSTSQPIGTQLPSHSTSLPIPSRSASRTGSMPPQNPRTNSHTPRQIEMYRPEKSDSQITKVTEVDNMGYENSNTYAATMTNYEKSTGSMLQTQKNQLPVQVIIQDRDQSYTLGNKDIETLEDSGSNELNSKETARDLLQSVRRKLGEFNEVDDNSFSTITGGTDKSSTRPFNGLLSSVARLGETSMVDLQGAKHTFQSNRQMKSEDYSALEDPIVDIDSPYHQDQTPVRAIRHSTTDQQNLAWSSAVVDPSVLEMLHDHTSPASNTMYSNVRGYCNQVDSTLANLKQGIDEVLNKANHSDVVG